MEINFKMTIRADSAVSACSPLPQPIKALAHGLLGVGGSWPLHKCPSFLPSPPGFPSIRNQNERKERREEGRKRVLVTTAGKLLLPTEIIAKGEENRK